MEITTPQLVSRQIISNVLDGYNTTDDYTNALNLDLTKHLSYAVAIIPTVNNIKYKIQGSNDNINWFETKAETTLNSGVIAIIKEDAICNYIKIMVKSAVASTAGKIQFQARLNPSLFSN
jgi:hypothetical protein